MKDISSTMLLVRLLALSLLHMSLVECQPTQNSSPPGVQPPLGTDNLSFPWSRLRLPRYLHLCFTSTYRKSTRKLVELCLKSNSCLFISGTSFLFTTTSSYTPTSRLSVSPAQCGSRSMSRIILTGLCYTAKICRSLKPPYWTRTSLISLTR